MGLSVAISLALSVWDGDEWDVALKTASMTGLKTFGISFISSVATSQLSRTGIEHGLRNTTDWVVTQLGSDLTSKIANAFRGGSGIYGAAAANNVSKMLRGNIVSGIVTTTVLSSADAYRFFKKEVSARQLLKNISVTSSSVVAGSYGFTQGAIWGNFIPLPPPFGAAVGGVAGSIIFGTVGQKVSKFTLGKLLKEDAEEMLEILNNEYSRLCSEFLINKSEGKEIIDLLSSSDLTVTLRKMHAAPNRREFARELLITYVKRVIRFRAKIIQPTALELMNATRSNIEGNGSF
ncbi:hypothetical protein [Vibrio sp. D431a]|uniref:hypothetical protein n=1 Tax=Vibrio sp. D431a TaxID=2837388 RepID=UPI00255650AA|nr:hypothetical protein [Vibrio sp. D431a]MDK9789872.1 hypothetical protein [Vibrio sp. D431a]